VNEEKKNRQLGPIIGGLISYSLVYSTLQVFMSQCTAGRMHSIALYCMYSCMCVCVWGGHCGCFLH